MNLTARMIIALAAAVALALPGAAFAREGESGGKRQTAALETVGAPADDTSAEAAEPTEPAESEAAEPQDAAGPETGDDRGVDAAGADDAPVLPELHPAFLKRSWKFEASADGFDAEAGVLSATLDKIRGLPRRLRKVRKTLADFDAAVLVGTRTRVIDEDGDRVAAADVADALDGADEVTVTGKVAKPRDWRTDEDGQPLATVRAKRIRIAS